MTKNPYSGRNTPRGKARRVYLSKPKSPTEGSAERLLSLLNRDIVNASGLPTPDLRESENSQENTERRGGKKETIIRKKKYHTGI